MASYETPYGTIFYGGVCQDSYANLVLYDQPNTGGNPVKLQQAAMRAFKKAEEAIQGRSVRRTPNMRQDPRFRPILLTGSWRSCELQARLHAEDPTRFVSADASGHCRGLCIDVSMTQSVLRRRRIRRALEKQGWHYTNSSEPWHASFVVRL
jgi:hypothetical protein